MNEYKNFLYRRYVIKLLQNSGNLYDGKKQVFIDNNYLYLLFSGGMKDTYYNRGFYYKILKSKNKNIHSYKFLIGKNPNCLEATLDYDPITKEYNNTLHIQYIQSNIKCGKIDGWKNKNANFSYIQSLYNSTSIIHSFIQYIKDNYPNVKYITLVDEANYPCNETYDSETIPLSTYYFFKYMKLYYMKKYKFKIYDYNEKKEIKEIKKFKKIVKLYKSEKELNDKKIKKIIFYLKKKSLKYKKINKKYFHSLMNEIKIIEQKLFEYKQFNIFLQKHKFIHCFIFHHIIEYFLKNIDLKISNYLRNINKLNFRYII
jgi:hypothetical protein